MKSKPVQLITVDPGHFHAALVQKSMYEDVDSTVHVYAPAGPDVDMHLTRIENFNKRAEQPTRHATSCCPRGHCKGGATADDGAAATNPPGD